MGLKTLGGPKRSWENNIKIDIQQVEWGDLYCIDLAEGTDRWRELGNAVMNFRILGKPRGLMVRVSDY
jgi:hypothetical protein